MKAKARFQLEGLVGQLGSLLTLFVGQRSAGGPGTGCRGLEGQLVPSSVMCALWALTVGPSSAWESGCRHVQPSAAGRRPFQRGGLTGEQGEIQLLRWKATVGGRFGSQE